MGSEMALIELESLRFSYHKTSEKYRQMILDGISLSIERNETVGVIGHNGAGKSTLLKLLVGIESTYTGTARVFGRTISRENLKEIRKKIGYVFQDSDSQLFMTTVYGDVAFAPENYGFSQEEVKKRTQDALKKVHMEQMAEKRIYQLSGGEKKLTAIATVLPMQPEIILLDEPSVALDPKNRRNLIHVLNEIQTTKIIASHDLDFIYDTCKRTILLDEGKVVADGETQTLLQDKELLVAHGLELPLSFSRR